MPVSSTTSSINGNTAVDIFINEKAVVTDGHSLEERNDDVNAYAVTERIPRIRFYLVITSLALSILLYSLDQTIVATAATRIASEFNTYGSISWIGTAYMLSSTAFQPLYGSFSDIFGRQYVLATAQTVFILGSLGCALSSSLPMLILFRSLSGLGGGGLLTVSMIIVADIVPPHTRPLYQGFMEVIFAVSAVAGPLLGGVFTDRLTWRWCFWINLPIGGLALAIILTCIRLPLPTGSMRSKLRRIDYLGSVLLISATVCILMAITWGGVVHPWSSPIIIALFCLSGALYASFAYVEGWFVKYPLAPGKLFRIGNQVAGYIASFLMGISAFSLMYYLPEFYQIVRGDSAMDAGIKTIPFLIVIAIVAIIAGATITRLGTWGYALYFSGGMGLMTVACALFRLVGGEEVKALEVIIMILAGAGTGLAIDTATLIVQITAPSSDIAVSTALQHYSLDVGGAFGIALSGAIIQGSIGSALPPVLESLGISADPHGSLEYLRGLTTEARSVVALVYVDAFRIMFTVLSGVAALSCLASLCIRVRRTHAKKLTKSAIAAVTP